MKRVKETLFETNNRDVDGLSFNSHIGVGVKDVKEVGNDTNSEKLVLEDVKEQKYTVALVVKEWPICYYSSSEKEQKDIIIPDKVGSIEGMDKTSIK
ncbi:hypothetical protein Tco_1296013 [Tanacetum coccineum]